MNDQPSARRIPRLEAKLRSIGGIRDARVEESGGAIRVRVVTLPESTRPTVIDAIVRASKALGFEITTDEIEVLGTSVKDRRRRRKLAYLGTTRAGESFTARVALELSGDTLIGEQEIDLGSEDEARAVAEATLNAVRQMTDLSIRVSSVETIEIGAQRIIVVALVGRSRTWVGSAEVGTDLLHATSRATLKALNRSLERPLA